MKEQLDRFSELIRIAIREISDVYLQTAYQNLHFQEPIREGGNYRYRNNILYHFGERVFCYEFYHKLRILLDEERQANNDFLPGCFLQGELKKHQLSELTNHFNIPRLRHNYIPDFLMHTPGEMELNASIIEVKVSHVLTDTQLSDDLMKMVEFILKYNYLQGIFIAINSRRENLEYAILHSPQLQPIRILDEEVTSSIIIVSRNWQSEQVESFVLSDVIRNGH